jgi:hypothetical protein
VTSFLIFKLDSKVLFGNDGCMYCIDWADFATGIGRSGKQAHQRL